MSALRTSLASYTPKLSSWLSVEQRRVTSVTPSSISERSGRRSLQQLWRVLLPSRQVVWPTHRLQAPTAANAADLGEDSPAELVGLDDNSGELDVEGQPGVVAMNGLEGNTAVTAADLSPPGVFVHVPVVWLKLHLKH